MEANFVKKGLWKLLVPLAVVLVLLAFVAYGFFGPVSPRITADGLRTELTRIDGTVTLETKNGHYRVNASEDVASLFCLEQWQQLQYWQRREDLTGKVPVMELPLGDEWYVAFYDDGYVEAYDGYSQPGKRGEVWYQIPEEVTEQVTEYFQANHIGWE